MKSSWTKYIIGCFLIIAFLFNGIVPDVMMLSGHLTAHMVQDTVAGQEDAKSERNSEEKQGDPRAEYLPTAHSSFYIDPAQEFFVSDYAIPGNIAFIKAVDIPVPTPPPDVTIV